MSRQKNLFLRSDPEMTSNPDKPQTEDDTDQWDWVPVEPRRNSRRARGAIVLAGSCLTLGVLIGLLSAPIFERTGATLERTASEIPKNLESQVKPLPEPSLALGGPSATVTKSQEFAPKADVVINEGSAKPPIEQQRARDIEQVGANETAAGSAETQAARPSAPFIAERSTDSPRPRRNLALEDVEQENRTARPDTGRTLEGPFKNYRDMRKHVLGQ